MAFTCPAEFDVTGLRDRVLTTYQRVAEEPNGDYHFHRGRDYAVSWLGYDPEALDALPAAATEAFAGVGNLPRIGPLHEGERVLDHACGAGLDLLLAAQAVGPTGRAIGVDMTPGMRARARRAAAEAGLGDRVDVLAGYYEALPIADDSIDVVLSNGVVNLAPDKVAVLSEVARVLRPGGRLHLADVVVQRELTLETRQSPDLWAACIAGALPEQEMLELFAKVGLVGGSRVERFDCFAGTSAEAKVSRDLRVAGVTFFAEKPL